MPELPEVERARAAIEDRALHRRIVAVDDADAYVCRPHSTGEIASALVGRELTEVHRRGKTMWVETGGGGPDLGLHLGMAGRIAIDEDPAPNRWDRFTLEFEDGGRMALRDKRRLSRARLDPDLSDLGPDAAEVSRAQFRDRVGRGASPIKARLLDQSVLAGVGNVYRAESLFRARLNPLTPGAKVSKRRWSALWADLVDLMEYGVQTGRIDTVRPEHEPEAMGRQARVDDHGGEVYVYRRHGQACHVCGAVIRTRLLEGRNLFWCPTCQRRR